VAFYLLSFFYGAAIGSFVQVVATRLNVAPIAKSKSKCLSCGEALRASDLVPVLSYLFLRGKCRYCKSPYGVSALIVEITFGLIFALLYHFMLFGVPLASASLWLLYYTLVFISLGVIALYDYRHSYVPVTYLCLFSFLSLIMLGIRYSFDHSTAVLLGPLAVSLPFLLIWLFTRGKALGFGDVILYMAVGAFFGIEQGLAVLLISVWLGALIGIAIYLLRRRKNNTSTAIPFVPFIVAAFVIVLFTDMSIFSFASLFA
jgi:leader peptidase (prepilin peptidase)/N-methyltransferase